MWGSAMRTRVIGTVLFLTLAACGSMARVAPPVPATSAANSTMQLQMTGSWAPSTAPKFLASGQPDPLYYMIYYEFSVTGQSALAISIYDCPNSVCTAPEIKYVWNGTYALGTLGDGTSDLTYDFYSGVVVTPLTSTAATALTTSLCQNLQWQANTSAAVPLLGLANCVLPGTPSNVLGLANLAYPASLTSPITSSATLQIATNILYLGTNTLVHASAVAADLVAPLTLSSAATVTVPLNGTLSVTITGGVPPYAVTLAPGTGLGTLNQSGATFTYIAPATQPASGVAVTVKDSVGVMTTLNITI